MCKLFQIFVNDKYVLSSDMCDSLDEFIDTYVTMIVDNFDDDDANELADKLNNRDFKVFNNKFEYLFDEHEDIDLYQIAVTI